jgi:non-lysosomal glucosylceramidase
MIDSVDSVPRQAWCIGLDTPLRQSVRVAKPVLRDMGPHQGLPLGGFGAGGIGRSYGGAFGRWTVKAGAMKNFCLPGNMFSVRTAAEGASPRAVALHPGFPPDSPPGHTLSAWNWGYEGKGATYRALFPKAWYHYPAGEELEVDLFCEQFSPVLPGQYRETSLPVGVFRWTLSNPGDRLIDASLMFSFMNMVGWFDDFGRGRPIGKSGENENRSVDEPGLRGVVMERAARDIPLQEGEGQFCIAARPDDGLELTTCAAFSGNGTGADLWDDFLSDGRLDDGPGYRAGPGDHLAGAVCVKTRLAPGESRTAVLSLAWDLPLIRFGGGREHWRRYTRHFDRSGTNAAAIAKEALERSDEWSRAADEWRQSVLEANPDRPDSLFSLLFNETYIAVDGLTVWTDGTRDRPGEDSFFSVIECPDYPFYSTFDLWVYAAPLFLHYWPDLERDVVRRYAKGLLLDESFQRYCIASGEFYRGNVGGALPHDLGQPEGDPAFSVNAYSYQNPNRWKDLNCQFVLNVYRDVVSLNDDALLEETWPAVQAALEYLARFDGDGDGMIENDGTPDQTMDNIPMKGVSLYCGGLWMSALRAASAMAERLGDRDAARRWGEKADAARDVFEHRLWTGAQYRFDTDGYCSEALFVDGLFGPWMARQCGLEGLADPDRMKTHLREVYRRNFEERDRRVGAVNIVGWKQPGPVCEGETAFNTIDCQKNEILYGLNLSFAGQLYAAGLEKEAETLLNCLYDTVYGAFELWFQTPSAWTEDGRFRAVLNLRPLVVWALVHPGAKSQSPRASLT